MSIASSCPRCHEPVSIPDDASLAAWMQCPLCRAEFILRDAFDLAPPALIVLDPGPPIASIPTEGNASLMSETSSSSEIPLVQFPDQADDSGGLPHFADDEDDDSGDLHIPLAEEAPLDGGAMIGLGLNASGNGDSAPSASAVVNNDPIVADASFDFGDPAPEGGEVGSGVGIESGQPRKRRQTNMLLEMVKVVVGGVVGLAIGYYIMLWIGEDPFNIADKLPSWLNPGASP